MCNGTAHFTLFFCFCGQSVMLSKLSSSLPEHNSYLWFDLLFDCSGALDSVIAFNEIIRLSQLKSSLTLCSLEELKLVFKDRNSTWAQLKNLYPLRTESTEHRWERETHKTCCSDRKQMWMFLNWNSRHRPHATDLTPEASNWCCGMNRITLVLRNLTFINVILRRLWCKL